MYAPVRLGLSRYSAIVVWCAGRIFSEGGGGEKFCCIVHQTECVLSMLIWGGGLVVCPRISFGNLLL